MTQFSGKKIIGTKASVKQFKQRIAKAKGYTDLEDIIGPWTGEQEFQGIAAAIEARPPRKRLVMQDSDVGTSSDVTPSGTVNPEPPSSRAPGPDVTISYIPPCVSSIDPPSPTPITG